MPIARKPSSQGGSVGNATTVKLSFVAKTALPTGAAVSVVRDTVNNVTELVLANASAKDTSTAVGFVLQGVNAGDTAEIIVGRGSLVTPIIVGGAALVPNGNVFLSTVDGEVTQTFPSPSGGAIFSLGKAISTTQMILTTDFMIGIS